MRFVFPLSALFWLLAPAAVSAQEEVPKTGFATSVLPGGTTAQLVVPFALDRLQGQPVMVFEWSDTRRSGAASTQVAGATDDTEKKGTPVLASISTANPGLTILYIPVPQARSFWPPWQAATIEVSGMVVPQDGGDAERTSVYAKPVQVSVRWFPTLIALATVAVIYPGIAALVYWRRRQRYRAAKAAGAADVEEPPSFWETLDPVQITSGKFGGASLSKLQVFGFSLIIFGLLLYAQLRAGILTGLSEDVLYLLGISAAGAFTGKFVAITKRRLTLSNWSWLRQKGWLPEQEVIAERAEWRELVTDENELDVYRFQMAIFSVIVAVALLTAGATQLATFEIPNELLALLGLSQAIYVGGKAIEPRGQTEFDAKLTDLRTLERSFHEKRAADKPAPDTLDAYEPYRKYHSALEEAADMFVALYGERVKQDGLIERALKSPSQPAGAG